MIMTIFIISILIIVSGVGYYVTLINKENEPFDRIKVRFELNGWKHVNNMTFTKGNITVHVIGFTPLIYHLHLIKGNSIIDVKYTAIYLNNLYIYAERKFSKINPIY